MTPSGTWILAPLEKALADRDAEIAALRARLAAAEGLLREWTDMYAFTHEADGSRNSVDYAFIDDVRERTEALLGEVKP